MAPYDRFQKRRIIKNHFFFAKTGDGLRAFSGADLSRARLARVHRRPLTGSTGVITPVLKVAGLSGENGEGTPNRKAGAVQAANLVYSFSKQVSRALFVIVTGEAES